MNTTSASTAFVAAPTRRAWRLAAASEVGRGVQTLVTSAHKLEMIADFLVDSTAKANEKSRLYTCRWDTLIANGPRCGAVRL